MPHRPLRPLVVAAVLAFGDYLLWNWSLSANHDIIALVSGMTLVPLLLAVTWLTVRAVAYLVAHTAQRPRARARTPPTHPVVESHSTLRDPVAAGAGEVQTTTPPSSKIAA